MAAENITSPVPYTTSSSHDMKPVYLVLAFLFFLTFLFGVVINSLFIWMLGFRLKRAVNTIWFFHLMAAHSIFIIITPFLGTFFLMDMHWKFGVVLCKVLNALMSLCMFTTVFLLTSISIDRYLLIFHPLWYRGRRTKRFASIISIFVWIISLIFCTPYFVFRDTRINEKNKTICYNNYARSTDWDSLHIEKLREHVHFSMFIMRLVLGFLLPGLIITFCYLRIAIKMKQKRLAKSSKPFKVILAAIMSFFICWTPYHLHAGMSIRKEHVSGMVLEVINGFSCFLICVNAFLTPVLYLCVGGNFRRIFKQSILSLFESAFNENFQSSEQNENKLDRSSHCAKELL